MAGLLSAIGLLLALLSGVHACQIAGLPPAIVAGIIAVESGGHPLALRINLGKGYSLYPDTLRLARRYLEIALKHTSNIDIGLMQVNWRTWGATARSLGIAAPDLLNAAVNKRFGCRILAAALRGKGSLAARLGRYHSSTPARQRAYTRRVLAAAAALQRR